MSSQGLEVLGAPIGSSKFIEEFSSAKFSKISSIVDKLSKIAKLYPQHSFATFSKSTKHKATYLARTVKQAAQFAKPYDDSLEGYLLTILGRQLDEHVIAQSSIPIARGGLGINIDFSDYSAQQFQDSSALTYDLTRHIAYGEPINNQSNVDYSKKIKANKNYFGIRNAKNSKKALALNNN